MLLSSAGPRVPKGAKMNTNWTRSELKMRGRQTFQRNYWYSVLASFLLHIGALGSLTITMEAGDGIPGGHGIIGLLLTIFVFNALTVGGVWFYYKSLGDPHVKADTLSRAFDSNYGNVTGTMFLRMLYTFLWSLLFVIPGIVKYYEYRLVPYLLAENPDMDTNQCLQESRDLMRGNKWNTFVLDLSFVGWQILSWCTFSLLGLFYVNPYKDATYAALYESIRYGTPGTFQAGGTTTGDTTV